MSFFSRLVSQAKTSVFVKHALILVSGTAGAQLITIAAMPLLSRLYSPAEFGVWAIFLAVSSITATFVTLRYETTILLPKNDDDAFRLVWVSGFLALGLGFLLVAVAMLLPDSFKKSLGIAVLGEHLPIAILAGISTAMLAIGNNWLNRGCAYGKMSMLRLVQSVALAGTALLLGLYGVSSGLLFSQIFALLLASILMFWLLRNAIVFFSKNSIVVLAKNYSHTPKYLLPTALLDTITLQLPILLITAWFSSEMAGQFSMAWKILAIPSSLIGAAVGQVFLQKFSSTWPNALAAKKLLYKTWFIFAATGLIPLILIILYGQDIFIFVLGKEWSEAGKIASVIAPMLYAILISSPTSGTFLVLGLQKYSLYFGLSFLIYRTAAIFYGYYIGSIITGLYLWIFFECIAIVTYNLISLKRLKT